jgi:hypothetical protein
MNREDRPWTRPQGRDPRCVVFARPLIGADGNALKQTEDRAGSLIKLRVFRPLDQNRSEHQAKETTLLQGEVDIGETDCAEWIALGRARLHRRGELSEAFRGDRRKEILLVGKMPIRGCRGHSDAAARCSRANVTASRRFVLIRSPDRFGIRAGATTMQSWPRA